jgi:Domain of unknown function DUF29
MAVLYDLDLYAWTSEQATLLKEGRYSALDVIHLIEELESLGESLVSQLESRCIVLLSHLLKLQYARHYERERAGRGWRLTCRAQRHRLARLLAESPSLARRVDTTLAHAYQTACLDAALGLSVEEETFPPTCPWTLEEILREDFFPSASGS